MYRRAPDHAADVKNIPQECCRFRAGEYSQCDSGSVSSGLLEQTDTADNRDPNAKGHSWKDPAYPTASHQNPEWGPFWDRVGAFGGYGCSISELVLFFRIGLFLWGRKNMNV